MNWSAVPPRSGWASVMARRSSLMRTACWAARSRSPGRRAPSAASRVAKKSRPAGARWRSPGIGLELLAADASRADHGPAPTPAVAGVVDQLCCLLDDRHLLDPAARLA